MNIDEVTNTLNYFKNNSKISEKNGNVVLNNPFFCNQCNLDFDSITTSSLDSHHITKSLDSHHITTSLDSDHIIFFNKYNFDTKFKAIYNYVGSDREIAINNFTFFCLDDIIKRSDNYSYILDIGLTYMGMGYVKMLSMYKKNGNFFFRMDGGATGYDRENNYNKYKNYKPVLNELLTFDQFIKEIEKNKNYQENLGLFK